VSVRRTVFLAHRWLGVLLSLFFAVWFGSGVVMIYVGYPDADDRQRIAGQAPLVRAHCCSGQLKDIAPGERLRLRMLEDALVIGREEVWHVAGSAAPLAAPDARRVGEIARSWLGADRTPIVRVTRLHNDQWTVSARYDSFRPLYRVELADGRWLHVAGTSGEIVLVTDRRQRGWNWVGAISHWIYFTALRECPKLWSRLIIWLATAGVALAAAGMWGGLKQWRWQRRKRGKSPIPYHGIAYWHHASGLVFGVLVFTFILSGLFSMNPWGLFSSPGVTAGDRAALHGDAGPLPPRRIIDAWKRFDAIQPDFAPRELVVFAFDGHWWLRFLNGRDAPRLMRVDATGTLAQLPDAAVESVADRLAAEGGEIDRVWLERPELYYYSHHGERPFPVLRLRLQDARRSWYYLDPASGDFAHKNDTTRRSYRWWFNALHSLDFPWLIEHRPAWDIVVILVCLGGLIVSATGVVVGWRRLRARAVPRRKPAADDR
jgi:hypothetical protein